MNSHILPFLMIFKVEHATLKNHQNWQKFGTKWRKLTWLWFPAYVVLVFITTLCILPNLPKYSGLLRTSESANLGDKPTTKTRFLWTTLTFAKCFRFSEILCFLAKSFCLLSALILANSSGVKGLKSAGFSE